jgi:hypothetical protein
MNNRNLAELLSPARHECLSQLRHNGVLKVERVETNGSMTATSSAPRPKSRSGWSRQVKLIGRKTVDDFQSGAEGRDLRFVAQTR